VSAVCVSVYIPVRHVLICSPQTLGSAGIGSASPRARGFFDLGAGDTDVGFPHSSARAVFLRYQ
jgi:hypothetical protein